MDALLALGSGSVSPEHPSRPTPSNWRPASKQWPVEQAEAASAAGLPGCAFDVNDTIFSS